MKNMTCSMSRALTSLSAVLVITALVSPLLASAPDRSVSLTRDARDPRWLRGEVLVDASPAQVLERVARVDRWSELFSDVRSVKVVKRSAEHWHVRLDTRTMDCGEHDYHITFSPGERLDLRIDAPGINAHGSLSAHSTGKAAQSTVKFELFIDTKGFMGWFIPERTLRKRQERMVRGDLEDLASSFTVPPAERPGLAPIAVRSAPLATTPQR